MKKYIKSITELNNLTLSNQNIDEIERYAESDIFWATNKNKQLLNRIVKKGNIYQFEFGKNFIPEMSYEHRGLVIGVSGKLLYVLPICSYNINIDSHKKAYHPVDNPNTKSNLFLLKQSEFTFLTHDSVLKLNDIRTVSIARIKYKQHDGYLNPHSDTYKDIEKRVFSKYFHNYSYEYDKLTKENKKLREEIDKLKKLNLELQKNATT
ncbi:MAG: hypothetical protein Q4G33_11560 [bacterium]|nr:hypothetical protein [bacterium]